MFVGPVCRVQVFARLLNRKNISQIRSFPSLLSLLLKAAAAVLLPTHPSSPRAPAVAALLRPLPRPRCRPPSTSTPPAATATRLATHPSSRSAARGPWSCSSGTGSHGCWAFARSGRPRPLRLHRMIRHLHRRPPPPRRLHPLPRLRLLLHVATDTTARRRLLFR